MDFGLVGGLEPTGEPEPEAGVPPFETYEPARWAMGDTPVRRTVDLIEMEPLGDLSSTGCALANPGEEYLVLEPNGDGQAITVQLAAGRYATEWFNVIAREAASGDEVADRATSSSLRPGRRSRRSSTSPGCAQTADA